MPFGESESGFKKCKQESIKNKVWKSMKQIKSKAKYREGTTLNHSLEIQLVDLAQSSHEKKHKS
jgi:hypothetical protein